MCGICGIHNYAAAEPVSRELLARMTAAMTHRGPDDDGFHAAGGIGLGMRRLSIIDLDGGAQPMHSEDGQVTVVQNGEIYNFDELRRELEGHGHTFRTQSDTEVIVHGYEQWGIDGLARLNGMFGLAVWDERMQRLVVARDPFGVKPVYWWERDGELAFASELGPLLGHPRVERAVDRHALAQYVELGYVPAPRTMFAGIHKLPPGHALVVNGDGFGLHRFDRPERATRSWESEAELTAELVGAVERAVRRQMVADVPVGVMLSGGIDSAALATIMTRLRGAPVDTFTVGFEGDFEGNELDAAREAARRIGANHHEVTLSPGDYAEWLPESIRRMEEPVATSQTLPFFKVCELARPHVKVVLTGQGADEPFAGYPRHLGERYGALYRNVPAVVRDRAVAPLVKRLPRNERLKRAALSLGTGEPIERMARVYSVIDPELKGRLLGENGNTPRGAAEALELWRGDVTELDDLNKMLFVDARTSLSDNLLLYGDKMSMAVSLEARVPYLDLELMELAESIPAGLKVNGRVQKHILKKAMAAWLPPEVINKPKKGFPTPMDRWLRTDLRAHVEERLLDKGAACAEHFDRDVVGGMIRDHADGRQDHKRTLFALLTFEIWHENFIAPAGAARQLQSDLPQRGSQ